ncbi:KAP-like P-loop domain-containing protein [Marinomonas alcarazii]|uniref:KAP-like P-loop domain-containing protein n=1 Tax=Marinomonas alcarazii TaxID=491949 RepID=A0A318UZF1_9GAMM|nr:KAP-like P-loop domain-containing protein [Marinomonas alcarazii]
MQTSQDLTSNEMAQFEDKLKNLEKEAILLCATRSVLRVFPLLADKADNKDYFYYWSDKDKPKYLLAIWHELLINYSLSNKSISTSETIGSVPANGSFIASYIAYASGRASAAKLDRHGALAPAKESIATAIDAAAIATSNNKHIHFPDIKAALDSDISQLENKEPSLFKQSSLWQKPELDYLTWLEKHLPEAFRQLSTEQEDRLTVGILNSIWPIYKGIFDGKPDQKAIDNALDQLEEYFSNKDIDEAESNKLFYGKDDEPLYGENNELFYGTNDDIESISGSRHNSDKPANKDKLNRQKLVDSLAVLLKDQNNHHHQTIGLLGHWGVGKTSVIKLLEKALRPKKLENKPEFLFAEFNAWEYEHTDNLQAGIAQEMIKALSSPEPKPICWEKIYWPFRKLCLTLRFAWSLHSLKILAPLIPLFLALVPIWFSYFFKEQFNQINKSITYIFATTWFIGFLYPTWKEIKKVLAGPLAKEFLTYLKLPDYGEHLGTIPVMREHIKKLTKVRLGNEKRLLYVVDDLDRCGHKGIVKVLEAVRMVLDLDNVIVVIAVDQRIALAALALNYKELATQHHIEDPRLIARDYLAKIIHLPIVLTEPDEASVLGYLKSLWKNDGPQKSEELKSKVETGDKFDYLQAKSADDFQAPSSLSKATTSNQTEPTTPIAQTNTSEPSSESDNRKTIIHKVKQVEQLTTKQKRAFSYWLNHFKLSNPRQIKRLNNSFNLLQNFYGQDKIINKITAKDVGAENAFPMMVTLFTFEYLNNLDDMQKRYTLKKLINVGNATFSEEQEKFLTDNKITPLVIELANHKLDNIEMSEAVAPFVLPGIDMIDKTTEKKESS